VMEKGKWMFEYTKCQSSHGESHISKCQSLLNHKEEVTWIRSEVLII
jgi:hypothetical protein